MDDSNSSHVFALPAAADVTHPALIAFMGTHAAGSGRLLNMLQASGFRVCGLTTLPDKPQTALVLVDLERSDIRQENVLAATTGQRLRVAGDLLTADIIQRAAAAVSACVPVRSDNRPGPAPVPPDHPVALDVHRAAEATGPNAATGHQIAPIRCNFSRRETEVIEKLIAGKPNKIIAFELGISEATAKVHMRNIMRKLGATNRTQVAQSCGSLRRNGFAF